MEKEKGVSGIWYLLGGAAVGAALGVLLAPKKGSETRSDLNEWTLRGREKAKTALSRIGEYIPSRVKLGAAAGAAKGGIGAAVSEGKEKLGEFVRS